VSVKCVWSWEKSVQHTCQKKRRRLARTASNNGRCLVLERARPMDVQNMSVLTAGAVAQW